MPQYDNTKNLAYDKNDYVDLLQVIHNFHIELSKQNLMPSTIIEATLVSCVHSLQDYSDEEIKERMAFGVDFALRYLKDNPPEKIQ